jgi:hypothetical protein
MRELALAYLRVHGVRDPGAALAGIDLSGAWSEEQIVIALDRIVDPNPAVDCTAEQLRTLAAEARSEGRHALAALIEGIIGRGEQVEFEMAGWRGAR